MDESRYILDRKDGRQRVRRLRGENLRDDCIQESTQGGGGSVMVWAGIHYGGKTSLVVPDGNINAVVYLDILETTAFHMQEGFMQTIFGCKTTTLRRTGPL
jgi:hypothetical protein